MVKDDELITRIKAGDENSFNILVREYLPRTFKKVRMLVPYEDAEDVTQDIFLNLVRSIYNFEGKSAFATWFNKIILNRVADYHRKMFRQKNKFISENEISGYELAQEDDNTTEMDDLLMQMPEAYREVILMKVCDNSSFSEIASTLGVTYEAARSRYRRGIKYAANKMNSEIFIGN